EQVTNETRAMLSQVAQYFTEQLKEMRSEMRREIEAMREELRRSILGLPQETADSAAQMRRVIVDQIEALAELNRIVARHGRSLDAAEPALRRMETVEAGGRRNGGRDEALLANGGPRGESARARPDITGMS